jgi:hypothetical protein
MARINYANVTASIALFVALSGTSYAAATLTKDSVKTEQIRNGAVKQADLGRNAVTGDKVKDGSLLGRDFKPGELPLGAKGEKGDAGPQGAKGEKGDRATDADRLDGHDSSEFTRGGGRVVNTGGTLDETNGVATPIAEVGDFGLMLHCSEAYNDFVRVYDRDHDAQLIVYSDDGSGTPERRIFVSGGVHMSSTPTDRVVIQAVNRTNPAIAMTATVTVADTGLECEYVVQATTSS